MIAITASSLPIAVVDDDPAVLAAVSFALEAEGYSVTSYRTADGLLASEALNDFACMVIDLSLPQSDGLGLVRQLRGRGVRTPAILVTTRPDARYRREAAVIGAPIIEKPLVGDALSNCIGIAARGPHPQRC